MVDIEDSINNTAPSLNAIKCDESGPEFNGTTIEADAGLELFVGKVIFKRECKQDMGCIKMAQMLDGSVFLALYSKLNPLIREISLLYLPIAY